MRTIIFWPVAAGLLLAGCSVGGTTAESSAPLTSGSASGEVAGAASPCTTSPPATRPLAFLADKNDGFLGSIVNGTGGDLYVNLQGESPCVLSNGESVPYASATPLDGRSLFASASADGPRSGTRFRMNDPYVGYPYIEAFSFDEGQSRCVGSSSGSNVKLAQGETGSLDEVGTGNFTAVRLQDDADAARQWTGVGDADFTDDWARVDITISRLGRCA